MTPWTVTCQAPLSLEFSRQEYWSGQPFPSPGYLPNPGIEPGFPVLQADSLPSEPPGKPFKGVEGGHCSTRCTAFLESLAREMKSLLLATSGPLRGHLDMWGRVFRSPNIWGSI